MAFHAQRIPKWRGWKPVSNKVASEPERRQMIWPGAPITCKCHCFASRSQPINSSQCIALLSKCLPGNNIWLSFHENEINFGFLKFFFFYFPHWQSILPHLKRKALWWILYVSINGSLRCGNKARTIIFFLTAVPDGFVDGKGRDGQTGHSSK